MTRTKATALATALGGMVETDPVSGTHTVGLVRRDGRYILLCEDAGACYFDRVACREGYMVHGSDPRGDISAQEWGAWDGSERWARDLALLLGPEAMPHRAGGNIWCVLYDRPDGQCVWIGEESVGVFKNRQAVHEENTDDSEHSDLT